MYEKWWHIYVLVLLFSIPFVGSKLSYNQAVKWQNTIPIGDIKNADE